MKRPEFSGAVTGLHADVLQGWVMQNDMRDLRVVVEVYVDSAFVTLARADQFEPANLQGDGFHGFAVPLRRAWLESATTISVRVANQGPWLAGAIQLPATDAPKHAAPFSSQVWYGGGLKVAGWAWDAQAPERHMEITVREGDRIVARGVANRHHPALVYRPTADHGFALDLPWEMADGKRHELHVETDRGHAVAGSPVTLLTLPDGVESLLRKYWPADGNPEALELLARIGNEQDRRAPRSAGFAHYPKWLALFQPAGDPKKSAKTPAGVLRYRDDGKTLVQAVQELLDAGHEVITPLREGDRLSPDAVPVLCASLQGETNAAWAFGDCDCEAAPGGERSHPWFKPEWDIFLFMGADIYTPGAAWGAPILRSAIKLLQGKDAPAGDIHGLACAVAAVTEETGAVVRRVTRVLYTQGHSAATSPAKGPANPHRQAAVTWLAKRMRKGATAQANPAFPALLQILWPLPSRRDTPLVSVIVPTRDQVELLRECVEGLLELTDYAEMEVIVVDNDTSDAEALEYLSSLPARGVKLLRYPQPFNYPAINNLAAAHARGSILCLLNNDISIKDPGWLKVMVAQLLCKGVGIVGAKLLWPNGMVQHGGVVIGVNGLAAHTGNKWHADDEGYLGFNQMARTQAAVTAACMLIRKETYIGLGGLDEKAFPVAFNDVDLCLRANETGSRVVWTPLAQLTHRESASRGKDHLSYQAARAYREQMRLMEMWTSEHHSDKWYHPALNSDWMLGPYNGLNLHPGLNWHHDAGKVRS